MIVLNFNRAASRAAVPASSTAAIKIQRAPPQRGPRFHAAIVSLPAANEVFVAPVMVVAVVIVIRAMVIVPRRAYAYADTTRSRIETNLCRGRQSRADRYRRHKRNNKLSHVLPPVLVAPEQ